MKKNIWSEVVASSTVVGRGGMCEWEGCIGVWKGFFQRVNLVSIVYILILNLTIALLT